ncbi:MAG: hypothetical protein ACTSVD_01960, partial [Candidatus Thorarchaeota archaeon]
MAQSVGLRRQRSQVRILSGVPGKEGPFLQATNHDSITPPPARSTQLLLDTMLVPNGGVVPAAIPG